MKRLLKTTLSASICLVFLSAGILLGDWWRPTGVRAQYVLAERNAVIIEAVFSAENKDPKVLMERVGKPIQNVIDRYATLGFVVLDVSQNEGAYEVLSIPAPRTNITNELRAAVATASQANSAAQNAAAVKPSNKP